MIDVKEIEKLIKEVSKDVKGIRMTAQSTKKSPRVKKVFPKTPSMLPNRYDLGETHTHYPYVKDDNGPIVIAGTRYSSKRQHYPVVS